MTPAVAKCLVVSKVLIADGMVTDEEHAFLAALMDRLGLSDADKKRVIRLDGLDMAEAVVLQLPLEERRQLIEVLFDAASADGKLSPLELKTVQRVSAALGIES